MTNKLQWPLHQFDATTKPSVLAVAKGNSKKNKVWNEAHDGVQ